MFCLLTAYPDVETRTITPEWEFMVMACDGIWDVLSNEVSNLLIFNFRPFKQSTMNLNSLAFNSH